MTMERLRDQESFEDPDLAQLAELVRASEPLPHSPSRERRVRESLRSRRSTSWVRRVGWLLAMSGGLAFAGTLRHWASVRQTAAPKSEPAPISTVVSTEKAAKMEPAPPVVAIPAPPVHRRPARTRVAAPAPANGAAAGDGSSLLVHALEALRHDHDAELAGELASRYLDQHLGGPLEEEALALAMEAAAARNDEQALAKSAARYLRQFPSGRFAGFAGSHTPND